MDLSLLVKAAQLHQTQGVSFSIYAIVDPRNQRIFYIGHSSRPELRRSQHLEGEDSLSGLTIRQIQGAGHVPGFVILEACETKERALMAEIFWIELMAARGAPLTNCQNYGGYVERQAERARLGSDLEVLAGIDSDRLEAVANGRPARWGMSWTRREEETLRKMAAEGKSAAEIADALQRTIGGVETRLTGVAPASKRRERRKRQGLGPTVH